MKRFIAELRRREVFRTAGLYVGLCWIAIEAADILLPTFDAPDWIFRGLIIAAFAGFPVMLVLAWFYDVTDEGIEKTTDPTDTVVAPIGRGKGDFIVIGILVVALGFSVYLNFARTPAGEAPTLEPVSVLIADFDNRTGDEVFDGALEQALQIGIEAAPFVTTFSRKNARALASQLRSGNELLDEGAARLVSVREGVNVVLAGAIVRADDTYELEVRVIDSTTGDAMSDPDVVAKTKADVLTAVGEISGDVRKALGDDRMRDAESAAETFTATSIEALQAYSNAQLKALDGDYEGSLALYAEAVELDPNFGRALSGWALSLFTLGRTDEAAEKWEQALSKMGTMTERERLRTLGVYYIAVAGNYEKAVETYSELVENYPADNAGRNNLAIASFAMLDFDTALTQGREALDIYPKNEIMRSNLALYAMYAGDFETARTEAQALLADNPDYFTAWLPIAMAANASGDLPGAASAYAQMASAGPRGASLSNLGLADLALFRADMATARQTLEQGIGIDIEANNPRSAAIKRVMLAEAEMLAGDDERARRLLAESIETAGLAIQVPAALAYLRIGDTAAAENIAAALGDSLNAQRRAYSMLVDGLLSLEHEDSIRAVEQLSNGLALADLWLLRFYRGLAYYEGGAFVEALDDFRHCEQRIGEATAAFLDDLPTWRLTALLPFWTARAEAELGMQTEAAVTMQRFVDYRLAGPEVEMARELLP
jgi:tetratricopeptide (TPR) repeat protein